MLTTWGRSWAVKAIAATAVLVLATAPADARRKFGSSSSSSSSKPSAPTAPSGAGKAAPPAKMSALDVALIGLSVQRMTSNKLRFLYELPPMKANTLPDGRHFHLGEVTRFLLGGRMVGWISRSEFVELKPAHLEAILDGVGFKSVAEFEAHLMKVGPSKGPGKQADGAAPAATTADSDTAKEPDAGVSPLAGFTQMELLALGCSGLALLGLLGFCFISWRSNRATDTSRERLTVAIDRSAKLAGSRMPVASKSASAAAPTVGRVARPLSPGTAAPTSARIVTATSTASGTTAPARRPARDLGALTRKPAHA